MLIHSIDDKYMGNINELQIPIICSLAKAYGTIGKHEDAIKWNEKVLKLELISEYQMAYSASLISLVWNKLKLIDNGKLDDTQIPEYKNSLQQAYYLATARCDDTIANMLKTFYENRFQEPISRF